MWGGGWIGGGVKMYNFLVHLSHASFWVREGLAVADPGFHRGGAEKRGRCASLDAPMDIMHNIVDMYIYILPTPDLEFIN